MAKVVSGKILLVDIGANSIKLVEAVNKSGIVSIQNTAIISNISDCVTEHGIGNMSKLVEIIITGAKNNGMNAKKILITSSAMGVKSSIHDYEIGSKIEEAELPRTNIMTRQTYGEITEQHASKIHVVESVASISIMKAIVEEFQKYKYSVISIEDAMTAELNLIKLQKCTYDFPGKILIDFGNKTRIFGCNQDAPVFDISFEHRLSSMLTSISEQIDISFEQMNELFVAVGLDRSEENVEILIANGIEPTSYFDCVEGFCRQYLYNIKQLLDGEIYNYRLGKCTVVVMGGFADIPGMYSVIESAINEPLIRVLKSSISKNYESDYLKIKNMLRDKQDIGCIYGPCIGILFKSLFPDGANLYPAKHMVVLPDKTAIFAAQLFKNTAFIAFVVTAVLAGVDIAKMVSIPAHDDIAALSAKQASLTATDNKLAEKISVLSSIDKTGMRLIEFTASYSDKNVKIISVDSQDMLIAEAGDAAAQKNSTEVKVSAPSLVQPPESAASQPSAQSSTEQQPAAEQASQNATVISEVQPDSNGVQTETAAPKTEVEGIKYIIRGYATDSNAVTNFYAALCEAKIAQKVFVYGVEKATLPNEESMNVFEIHLVSDIAKQGGVA